MRSFSCSASLIFLLLAGLPGHALHADNDSLVVKAHIPWTWINDFEFYEDGIFITPYENNGIGYFTIDSSYNLTHQYTVFPVPSPSHRLVQCCIEDSFLFALDGSNIHPVGEPVFFTYKITESGYTFLAGLEPTGTVWPTGFDPIVYHNGDIIYSDYPQTFIRINVTNPASPYVTAKLVNGDFDVCRAILPYEDSLLITSRQCGSAYWDGNFRLIKNNEPDTLISLGKYGTNKYSYTAGITNIGSVLFTAHNQGLVVYDISDFGNVQEIYFYATAWARFIKQANYYIFMSCNNGWHVFEYVNPSNIQHLQYLANDTRVLWMKLRPGYDELWCFADGGNLGGLVISDISDFTGVKEETNVVQKNSKSAVLSIDPNPFSTLTTISFSLGHPDRLASYTTSGAESIELKIYDAAGCLVKDFSYPTPCAQRPTHISWDATDGNGRKVPAGIYFVRLTTPDHIMTEKVILLR